MIFYTKQQFRCINNFYAWKSSADCYDSTLDFAPQHYSPYRHANSVSSWHLTLNHLVQHNGRRDHLLCFAYKFRVV